MIQQDLTLGKGIGLVTIALAKSIDKQKYKLQAEAYQKIFSKIACVFSFGCSSVVYYNLVPSCVVFVAQTSSIVGPPQTVIAFNFRPFPI